MSRAGRHEVLGSAPRSEVRVWSLTVCRWPLTRSASSAVAIEHSAHPTTAIRNIGFVQRSSRRNVTGTPEAGHCTVPDVPSPQETW